MSHRSVRTAVAVTTAVVACVAPLLSAGAAEATETARITALVPGMLAAGGTPSADGRWMLMPGGAKVSLRPMVFADCPGGSVCLWQNANYAGVIVSLSGPGTSIANLASVGLDNAMTSWGNRSEYDARWYYGTNFTGTTRCMNAASANQNVGATDNDQASSFRVFTDAAACS